MSDHQRPAGAALVPLGFLLGGGAYFLLIWNSLEIENPAPGWTFAAVTLAFGLAGVVVLFIVELAVIERRERRAELARTAALAAEKAAEEERQRQAAARPPPRLLH